MCDSEVCNSDEVCNSKQSLQFRSLNRPFLKELVQASPLSESPAGVPLNARIHRLIVGKQELRARSPTKEPGGHNVPVNALYVYWVRGWSHTTFGVGVVQSQNKRPSSPPL